MTEPIGGELRFGSVGDAPPVGFTNSDVSNFDGSAEPVVREVIQNSVDAADKDGRDAEVRFVITKVPIDEIPGLSKFRETFYKAVEYRKESHNEASHDEQSIIRRIKRMLSRKTIPILLCADNGCGLDPLRMTALLSTGNTEKSNGGVGSFGLGHYAAFGASDMHYVLYGSKYMQDGAEKTIASGHAILATHIDEAGNAISNQGYWRRTGWAGTPWHDGSEFPTDLPEMLARHLTTESTGTVVAITGFNDFRREDDEATAVEQIMQVAAANFGAAIFSGRLIVTVVDANNQSHTLDRDTLDVTLEDIKDDKRSTKAGHITGAQAYAAWRTLRDGATLMPEPHIRIKWRRIDEPNKHTQVHLYRRGMWISSRISGLLKRDLERLWPCDAVILLDEGKFEAVVKASEGPEHRGLDRKRLTKEQKKQLKHYVNVVAEALRATVGERDNGEEYIPQSFATISGHQIREAETVRRPRRSGGGGNRLSRTSGGSGGGSRNRSQGSGKPRHSPPRSSTRASYRHSLRVNPAKKRIEVHLSYAEDTSDGHEIGVSLCRTSGADGTCEKPMPDDYLPLAAIEDLHGNTVKISGGGKPELRLPAVAGMQTLYVELAEHDHFNEFKAAPHLLDLEVLKRPVQTPAATQKATP